MIGKRGLHSHFDKEEEDSNVRRFEWKSRGQHILFFLVYLMDYGGLGFHIYEFTDEKIQSLGYSMLLVSFFKFALQMYYTSILVFYLMASLCNASPPWMKCFGTFYQQFPNCFSREDIDLCPSKENSDQPCFPAGTKTLSTYIFKEIVAFGNIKHKYKSDQWLLSEGWFKILFHAFNEVIVYIVLIIAAQKPLKNLYGSLRIAVSFGSIALLSILVVVITRPGASFGLTVMFSNIKASLWTPKTWVESYQSITGMMRMAEGAHFLFGSFIAESKPDIWRALHLTHAFIDLTILASVYFFLFLGLLYYKLNMELVLLESSEENKIFITCPVFLGIQASATFFCVSFFFVLTIVNIHSLAIKLIVLEKSITIHLNIPEYFFYIRFALGTLAFILTYFLSILETAILKELRNLFTLFEQISITLQIVVVLLYGLQRLYDDIEYVMKTKVNKFIRLNLIATPIFSGISFYHNYQFLKNHSGSRLLRIAFIITMSMPFVLCLFYKIFSFGKQNNLIGIFKPTDDFGPPDIEKRILRILHNPRLEVRYKRREEVCQHQCLIDSKAVEIAIGEEIDLNRKLSQEIAFSTLDKGLGEKIISQITKHQEYLMNVLAKEKK